jgi:hypothetical protein
MPAHSRTRRTVVLATVLAAVGTGAALTLTSPATAGQHLHLTTTNPLNTDLDLGDPGPSAGDTQVFVDELLQDGEQVGSSTGTCTLTALSDTRLAGNCVATMVFSDGSSLTTQGAFDENPQEGPAGYRWAVTGGTGDYRGASGEAIGTFRPNTDTVDIEVRLD